MERLFTCFPVLEDLIIVGLPRQPWCVHVQCLCAWTEDVEPNFWNSLFCSEYVHWIIDAPKLENLDLKRIATSNLYLVDAKSQINASIAFEYLSGHERLFFPGSAMAIFARISNVKLLYLSIVILLNRSILHIYAFFVPTIVYLQIYDLEWYVMR